MHAAPCASEAYKCWRHAERFGNVYPAYMPRSVRLRGENLTLLQPVQKFLYVIRYRRLVAEFVR
jgi:hypothetical protein